MEFDNVQISKVFLETIPSVMRSIRTEMREAASGGLTVPQSRVIGRLSRVPSTNRELAEWMGVSAPSMSRMVDTLVQRGLIERRIAGKDRREVLLTLSEKGVETHRAFFRIVQKKFARRISELRPAHRKTLLAGLDVLKEMFQ